eukprot:2496451-Rhodomonas_salina.1
MSVPSTIRRALTFGIWSGIVIASGNRPCPSVCLDSLQSGHGVPNLLHPRSRRILPLSVDLASIMVVSVDSIPLRLEVVPGHARSTLSTHAIMDLARWRGRTITEISTSACSNQGLALDATITTTDETDGGARTAWRERSMSGHATR